MCEEGFTSAWADSPLQKHDTRTWPPKRRSGASKACWQKRCKDTSNRPAPNSPQNGLWRLLAWHLLFLRELAGRLRELEALTNCADRELNAAYQAVATERRKSTEGLLDRALASMELLGEAAENLNRRVDELLKT